MPPPQLYNDRNVYIVGAGFSTDAGLPVLSTFMNRMRDSLPWLQQQGWGQEEAAILKVLQFRLESSGAAYRVAINVENLEDLFSLAAATDNNRLAADLVRAIAATLSFAEATTPRPTVGVATIPEVAAHFGWTASTVQGLYTLPLYDCYVGLMSGHFGGTPLADNTFITFNYDTLVESAARRLRIPYDYGFAGSQFRFEPGAAFSPALGAEDGLRILKIHGSVSWAFPGGRGKHLTPYDDYSALRELELVPVLLPPTWKKGDTRTLDRVWSQAVDALRTATRIFVIGCSLPLTDSHFRYLMAAGLRDNISLRSIVVVNPALDDGDLRDRVISVFPSHLMDQGILSLVPSNLGWMCRNDAGRNLMHRMTPDSTRFQ